MIALALARLGISQAVVLGHSWGASVAVALGLRYPQLVKGLVLVSGYYYPTVRADALLFSGPRLPLVGTALSHTVAPLVARAIWPLLTRKIFAPAPIPAKFERGFPKGMALRPSQIRASAEESALLIPTAAEFRKRYRELTMPVVIAAGANDQVVTTDKQSARLHRELPHSTFRNIPGGGHMVHQTSTAEVLSAIHEVAQVSQRAPLPSRLSQQLVPTPPQ